MKTHRLNLRDVLATARTSKHRQRLVRALQTGRIHEVVKSADLTRGQRKRVADRVDGYDRDDTGESPDY